MQKFDITCSRCRLNPIDALQGILICKNCRLLILNYVFSVPVPINLLDAATAHSKPWNSQSMRSLWEVMYSRQRRTGSPLDHWLLATFDMFGREIAGPPPRLRGVPTLNLKSRQPDYDAETAKLMRKVRKKIKALRADQKDHQP